MPYLIDPRERVDEITAAVNRLLARGGLPALTTRAIAREVGVSPGTLTYQLSADVTIAVVRGLRAAVCAGAEPMPTARARELLEAFLERQPTAA